VKLDLSALGKNCGPLLICRANPEEQINKINELSIAIPGINTTANLLLKFAFPNAKNKDRSKAKSFKPQGNNHIELYIGDPINFTPIISQFREKHPGMLENYNRITFEHIELPFTIPPNVGDFINYQNNLGEMHSYLVTKRIFSEGTNNIIINFKNY
jgi:hypothetical protein